MIAVLELVNLLYARLIIVFLSYRINLLACLMIFSKVLILPIRLLNPFYCEIQTNYRTSKKNQKSNNLPLRYIN